MRKLLTIIFILFFSLAFNSLWAQKIIRVEAGDDQIAAAYDEASAGDIIELITSGGVYTENEKIKIKKDLTIRAKYGLEEKPTVVAGTDARIFEPTGGCTYFELNGFKFTGLVDDGVTDSKDSTKYAMRVRNMDTTYSIICRNVDFDYFISTEDPPEGYVIRLDGSAVYADEILFENCMFSRIEKHVFRADDPSAAPGQFGSLEFKNCTFADIGQRGLNVDLLNEAGVDSADISINHCTFAGIGSDAIRISNGFGIDVKNSIFYDIADDIFDTDSAATYTSGSFTFCDTLNTGGFSRFLNLTTSDLYAENPEFKDAVNLDFTVSTFFKGIAVGDDGMVVGDLAWDPDNPVTGNGIIAIQPGINDLENAYDVAKTYGANVIEMSSPGTYIQENKIKVKIPLLVRGAKDLAEKPLLVAGTDARPFEPTGGCTFFGLEGFKYTGFVDDGVEDGKDTTKYAMRIRKNDGPITINIDNVDFDYFFSSDVPTEGYIIRFESDYAPEVRVTNSTFTRVGKHIFRFDAPTRSPGQFGSFYMENCTLAKVGQRGLYAELINEEGVDTARVFVNHCTFADLGSDALKLTNCMDFEVKNSIFYMVGDDIVDADSAEVYSTGSFTYNDTLLTGGFSRFLNLTTANIYAEDPEFTDPDNLNYTVSSFFAGIALGDDGKVVGDLRWDPATAIRGNGDHMPGEFSLHQNYPNPFNPSTLISYNLANTTQVSLVVYDIVGRKVKTLVQAKQKPGQHHLKQFPRKTNSLYN